MSEFRGYPLPAANQTFVPNQYLDLVLPTSSRGVVRLVGYMLRRMLAWSDRNGHPQEPRTGFTWGELEAAGISRGAISDAIAEAEALGLIRVQRGSPSRPGQPATSGLVALRWDDDGPYVTDPAQFRGFYGGRGCRTWIPNAFFDRTLPAETLAVVRVVGAVLRQTIGWEDRYGYRRQEVALSISELQRVTRLGSRRIVLAAVETAIDHHLIELKRPGVAGAVARAAVYGPRWERDEGPVQKVNQPLTGSKSEPGPVQKVNQAPVQKVNQDRFKKFTTPKGPEMILKESEKGVDTQNLPDPAVSTWWAGLSDRERQEERQYVARTEGLDLTAWVFKRDERLLQAYAQILRQRAGR